MQSGVQQATPERGEAAETSTERACRLKSQELATRLWDRAYCGKSVDTLCEEAANEIVRLSKLIEDYVAICSHSSREIAQLRAAAAKERIVVVP